MPAASSGGDCWSDGEAEDQRHHEDERRHPDENGALSCLGGERVQLVSFTIHAHPIPRGETLASRSKGQTSHAPRLANLSALTMEQAARRLSVSPTAFGKLEAGARPAGTVIDPLHVGGRTMGKALVLIGPASTSPAPTPMTPESTAFEYFHNRAGGIAG